MADGLNPPTPSPLWLQTVWKWVTSRVGVVSVTAAYTVPSNIFHVRADVTSAGFTVTLPAAATRDGRQISVKKIDASGNTLTLGVTGSDTIDGTATKTTTTQYASWLVIINGNTGWDLL